MIRQQNWKKEKVRERERKNEQLIFSCRRMIARLQILRLFWCPRDIYVYYICLSALKDHHAVYTLCIGRMHSLATTSGPARKVGAV